MLGFMKVAYRFNRWLQALEQNELAAIFIKTEEEIETC